MTILAQWADADGVLNLRMIDFVELEGSHSGYNMAASVYDTLNNMRICSKVRRRLS